ncbi:MAG: 50S ribosomal protein L3 [Candidatus Woesearchaeota archaeon]|nr:50S ribosomal protein L3 [Candidatus Woesearchaeota archaeon]
MPRTRKPRAGSMQYWPRKRARREYPRVRAWAKKNEVKLLGFAGYKVGMTHILHIDNRKNSITKGLEISCPVTLIECPPLKIISARFYKKSPYGLKVEKEVYGQIDKEIGRKICLPKKQSAADLSKINPEEYDDITVVVSTQPKLTGIGKKKPEIFEVGIGGNIKQKFEYAKSTIGKEVKVNDIFKEGQLVDIHAVTKGKGYQGPVKRFGVSIRQHKSEKTKRGPGSLGAWCAQGHMMYRVAHAGQMGYQTRTEYNKWLLKIFGENEISKINPKSGFHKYGVVKNSCLMIKGSIPGPIKRMIRINSSIRDNKRIPKEQPVITYINIH